MHNGAVDHTDASESVQANELQGGERHERLPAGTPPQSSTMPRPISFEGMPSRSPRLSVNSQTSQTSLRRPQGPTPSVRALSTEDVRATSIEAPVPTENHRASSNVSVLTQASVHSELEEGINRVRDDFTPDERRLEAATTDLFHGNFANNPELRQVIEQSGHAGLFANWQLKTPRAQQNAIARFLLDVANNNFENKTAMKLASLFNMSVKGGFCVMLMTFCRQLASNGMSDDAGFTDEMRKVAGGLIGALPAVLLTIGGIKDFKEGTATPWSSIGRGTLGLVGATALAVTAALGNLGAAAPALAAFGLAYCLGRDSSQLFIRTPGQMKGIQFKPSAVSGVGYGGVEMGVGTAMSYGAPGASVRADGLRGGFNGAGEFADDVNLTLSHLFKEGMDETQGNAVAKLSGGLNRVNDHFRNRLSLQVPTGKEVVDMFLGTYPARAALFGIVVMAAVNFSVKTPKLDATKENDYGNLLTALILGTLYTAFGGMFAKRDPNARRTRDVEGQNEGVAQFELQSPVTDYRSADTPRREPPMMEEIHVDAPPQVHIPVGARTDDHTPTGSLLATGVRASSPSTNNVLLRAASQRTERSSESEFSGRRQPVVEPNSNDSSEPNVRPVVGRTVAFT